MSVEKTFPRTNRPWGWYEEIAEWSGNKVKRISVEPGQSLSLQMHFKRSEHWVVVAGVATVTVGNNTFQLAVGQHCDIQVEQVHRLANNTNQAVEIVEVQFGKYLGEDDIVRFNDMYGRN